MKPIAFFCPELAINTARFRLHGLGFREPMRPGIVDRPHGTGDYLLMLFYDPVRLKVAGRDQPEVHAPPVLMFWPDGAGHYYGNRERAWCHSWIHCKGTFVDELAQDLQIPLGTPIRQPGPEPFEAVVQTMVTEVTRQASPDPIILQNLFHNWLRQLSRLIRERDATSNIPPAFLKLRQQLDTELAEPLMLEDLAAAAGLSRSHFSALFRQHFGCAPIAYLIRRRMYAAAYLLRNRRLAVREIARRVGYRDEAYFSRHFRKYHGMSPRAWRDSQAQPSQLRFKLGGG